MKKHIVLDLDDCILNLSLPMFKALNHATGKSVSKHENVDYSLSMYDLSQQDFFTILKEYKVLESALPYRGSIRTINRLYETHNIHIVTATNRFEIEVRITIIAAAVTCDVRKLLILRKLK